MEIEIVKGKIEEKVEVKEEEKRERKEKEGKIEEKQEEKVDAEQEEKVGEQEKEKLKEKHEVKEEENGEKKEKEGKLEEKQEKNERKNKSKKQERHEKGEKKENEKVEEKEKGKNNQEEEEEEEDDDDEEEEEEEEELESMYSFTGEREFDKAVKMFAKSIFVDEMCFSMVDGLFFRHLMRSLNPYFHMPCAKDMLKLCMTLYRDEKSRLKSALRLQCVSLSADTWVNECATRYSCLTTHWIDNEWKLHKKILSFRKIPYPYEEREEFGEIIEDCLRDWGIRNYLTITMDNATFDDGAVEYLKRKTRDWKGTVLGHEFLHLISCAHIVSLIVKEALDDQKDSFGKIRDAVCYVGRGKRLRLFKKIVERENLELNGPFFVSMDNVWDSAYMMLEMAEKLEKAFEMLCKEDPLYLSCFYPLEEEERDYWEERESKKDGECIGPPTDADWGNARCLAKQLRIFFKVIRRLSNPSFVTSNALLSEILGLKMSLAELTRSEDRMMGSLSERVKRKFDEYWENLGDINPLLYVAVVLDPRYKLKYVKFCLDQACSDKSTVESLIKRVNPPCFAYMNTIMDSILHQMITQGHFCQIPWRWS